MTLTFGAGPFRAALAYFLFALKVVVVAYSGQHLQHLHKAMHVCICRSFSMVLTTDAAWNLWPGISGIVLKIFKNGVTLLEPILHMYNLELHRQRCTYVCRNLQRK
jgi:hypothetical protein